MKKILLSAVFVMSVIFLSSCAGKKSVNYDVDNFYEVCSYGKTSEISKMIKNGTPVNKLDVNGISPLMYAVTGISELSVKNQFSALKAGNEKEFVKSLEDNKGKTFNPNVKNIELLLKEGANINAQNRLGYNSFTMAALYGNNPKVLELLKNKGADTTQTIQLNSSAGLLSMACVTNTNPAVIDWLCKNGFDVNETNSLGTTPIMWAAMYNSNPDVIDTLVNNGADINDNHHKNGYTPLIWSVRCNKNAEITKRIMKLGSDYQRVLTVNKKSLEYWASENQVAKVNSDGISEHLIAIKDSIVDSSERAKFEERISAPDLRDIDLSLAYSDTQKKSILKKWVEPNMVTVIQPGKKERIIGNLDDENSPFMGGRIINLSSYSVSKYEVTQEEYQLVMGSNPSINTKKNLAKGENQNTRPVENVTWFDAVNYCNKLTELIMGTENCVYKLQNIKIENGHIKGAEVMSDFSKKGYRLLSDAEWEYAARGANPRSSEWKYKFAGSNNADEVAWNAIYNEKLDYYEVSESDYILSVTHSAGLKKSNSLGLFDMCGNVGEFVADYFFSHNEKGEFDNPINYESGFESYCVRGGSYYSSWNPINTRIGRAEGRIGGAIYLRDSYVGFRIGRTL